jgi:hypothetical protein
MCAEGVLLHAERWITDEAPTCGDFVAAGLLLRARSALSESE